MRLGHQSHWYGLCVLSSQWTPNLTEIPPRTGGSWTRTSFDATARSVRQPSAHLPPHPGSGAVVVVGTGSRCDEDPSSPSAARSTWFEAAALAPLPPSVSPLLVWVLHGSQSPRERPSTTKSWNQGYQRPTESSVPAAAHSLGRIPGIPVGVSEAPRGLAQRPPAGYGRPGRPNACPG